MVIFIFTGAFIALAIATTAQPTEPASNSFDIKLLTQGGVPANQGRYLSAFHTGAGMNAAIGVKCTSQGVRFSYNATGETLGFQSSIPYAMQLAHDAPFNSSASDYGFKVVTTNVGNGTPGFYPSKNAKGEYILKSKALQQFDAFVPCKVNRIAPYYSEGPQYQLLWRPKNFDAIPACSDITFKATWKD